VPQARAKVCAASIRATPAEDVGCRTLSAANGGVHNALHVLRRRGEVGPTLGTDLASPTSLIGVRRLVPSRKGAPTARICNNLLRIGHRLPRCWVACNDPFASTCEPLASASGAMERGRPPESRAWIGMRYSRTYAPRLQPGLLSQEYR
jgi:hypothetical protein